MERFNTNDEFESFLQEEADDHRIYPTEKVWENIREDLHGNKSWPALTFIALFIVVSLTVTTIFNYPPDAIIAKTSSNIIPNHIEATDEEPTNAVSVTNEKLQEQINPEKITQQTFEYLSRNKVELIQPVSVSSGALVENNAVNVSTNSIAALNKSAFSSTAIIKNQSLSFEESKAESNEEEILNDDNKIANTLSANDTKTEIVTKAENANTDPNADAYSKEFGFEKLNAKKTAHSKFELQFYFTPSVSYRKLEDDVSAINSLVAQSNPSTQSLPSNVNSAVRHTPALGTEVGAMLLYNLTPSFKVRAGLQFNVRQYYIDAYQSAGLATFALVQNNHLDSIRFFSSFSNNSGNAQTKLDNKLYQISIPIGFQWDFVDGEKFGVSVGATLQPTFTLNKNVYMISTDYKYYANGAPFFRKWNINTGIDLMFTYKTGNLKWYLGPQIRYQHLPTYNDIYPIKEYRLDYGFKMGVALPLH